MSLAGDPHPSHWADVVNQNIVSFNRMSGCGGTTLFAANTLYTTISHNEVTNTRGRFAISVGGWKNLEEALDYGYRVEYNHVHHVLKDADDSGAIKTAGLTHDSCIRYNLIHDVEAGYFNSNVGIWFDNMSSGWVAERNILYNLPQGDMKLCAANLVDNVYRDNLVIPPPQVEPEPIIRGLPRFEFGDLLVQRPDGSPVQQVRTGEPVLLSAEVRNLGSTGMEEVELNVDGRIVQSKLFAVVRHDRRRVTFTHRFARPGEHRVAIGSTRYRTVLVEGPPLEVLVDSLRLSHEVAPEGESVAVSALVRGFVPEPKRVEVPLLLDGKRVATRTVQVQPDSSVRVTFQLAPPPGVHRVRVGNSLERKLEVFGLRRVDLSGVRWKTTCSPRAEPCDFQVDPQRGRFRIQASGTDFFHAEDSYAAIYLPQKVRGNFVATVKVDGFSPLTPEWFRAGIFVRNDVTKTFAVLPGSPGSVLVFTTPRRVGLQWDEFADGSMHRAVSLNLPENFPLPVWLKLVRRGDRFTGSVSLDGEHWEIQFETTAVRDVAAAVDLGLAAGSNDGKPRSVKFSEFSLQTEVSR